MNEEQDGNAPGGDGDAGVQTIEPETQHHEVHPALHMPVFFNTPFC